MKPSNNTVLITGGSSGIGLRLSVTLLERGNKVIICGRSPGKLAAAEKSTPGLITYPCDLSDVKAC